MYAFPELEAATDALWSALRDRLREVGEPDVPAALLRQGSEASLTGTWRDPALLLGQTCGYPLRTALRDQVTLVATPVYTAPFCHGPTHCSVIVVRAADARPHLADYKGARAAVNAPDSNTGHNLLRALVSSLAEPGGRFFAELTWTGAHAKSAHAVATGRADLAAIDCVTWALLARVRPSFTAPLRVLGTTASTPALPLITSRHTSSATLDALRRALNAFAADPSLQTIREALLIERFVVLPVTAYDMILELNPGALPLDPAGGKRPQTRST